MQIKGIKIGLVIFITIIMLSLLLLSQHVWETQVIYKPLLAAINNVEGVESANVEKQRGNLVIIINLNYVDNFAFTYHRIEEEIHNNLSSNTKYKIQLQDTRDKDLSDLYLSLSSYIQEGIQTGKYSYMEELIQQQTKNYGVEYHNIFVDYSSIYIQLHRDQNYLYEVIPRQIG